LDMMPSVLLMKWNLSLHMGKEDNKEVLKATDLKMIAVCK